MLMSWAAHCWGIVAFFAPKCLSNLWPRENGRVLPNDLSEFIKRFDLGQLPQVVNQDVNDVANYYGSWQLTGPP